MKDDAYWLWLVPLVVFVNTPWSLMPLAAIGLVLVTAIVGNGQGGGVILVPYNQHNELDL